MNFGTLDMNNLVLLVIAAFTLANTVMVGINARQSVIRTQLARETKAVAIETREIAKKTEINTNGQNKEREEKMAALFNNALASMKKDRRK